MFDVDILIDTSEELNFKRSLEQKIEFLHDSQRQEHVIPLAINNDNINAIFIYGQANKDLKEFLGRVISSITGYYYQDDLGNVRVKMFKDRNIIATKVELLQKVQEFLRELENGQRRLLAKVETNIYALECEHDEQKKQTIRAEQKELSAFLNRFLPENATRYKQLLSTTRQEIIDYIESPDQIYLNRKILETLQIIKQDDPRLPILYSYNNLFSGDVAHKKLPQHIIKLFNNTIKISFDKLNINMICYDDYKEKIKEFSEVKPLFIIAQQSQHLMDKKTVAHTVHENNNIFPKIIFKDSIIAEGNVAKLCATLLHEIGHVLEYRAHPFERLNTNLYPANPLNEYIPSIYDISFFFDMNYGMLGQIPYYHTNFSPLMHLLLGQFYGYRENNYDQYYISLSQDTQSEVLDIVTDECVACNQSNKKITTKIDHYTGNLSGFTINQPYDCPTILDFSTLISSTAKNLVSPLNILLQPGGFIDFPNEFTTTHRSQDTAISAKIQFGMEIKKVKAITLSPGNDQLRVSSQLYADIEVYTCFGEDSIMFEYGKNNRVFTSLTNDTIDIALGEEVGFTLHLHENDARFKQNLVIVKTEETSVSLMFAKPYADITYSHISSGYALNDRVKLSYKGVTHTIDCNQLTTNTKYSLASLGY